MRARITADHPTPEQTVPPHCMAEMFDCIRIEPEKAIATAAQAACQFVFLESMQVPIGEIAGRSDR